jgi:hypothetical protein
MFKKTVFFSLNSSQVILLEIPAQPAAALMKNPPDLDENLVHNGPVV